MKVKIATIHYCAEVQSGYSFKGAVADEPGGTLQVITAQHLDKDEPYRYREEHRLRIVPSRSCEKYLVNPGDILFMSRGAANYPVLIEMTPPAIAPLSFFIIKPRVHVLPQYLAWCLGQEPFKDRLNEIRTGAGTPMIPSSEFKNLTIPLPPLEVQQRIAKLAALQVQEKALFRQLMNESGRLQQLAGKRIFSRLTDQ
jgi:hypothetical protein